MRRVERLPPPAAGAVGRFQHACGGPGAQLRVVERLAWHPDDDSLPNLNVGSVHLWFEGGRCVHVDTASDWALRWSVSEPGDSRWMGQSRYEYHGRWVIRDASAEAPFAEVVGARLTSAVPVFNEMNEVIGATLNFGERELSLRTWEGEIDTSPR